MDESVRLARKYNSSPIENKRFGRLVALWHSHTVVTQYKRKSYKKFFKCICDCTQLTTVFLELNGERKALADWCHKFNLKRKTIYARLRAGKNAEQALGLAP